MRVRIVSAQSVADLDDRLGPAGDFTLAIVFAAATHDIEALSQCLARRGLDVFGATSAGEIVETAILEEAIAVALVDLPRDCFLVRTFPHEAEAPSNLGARIGAWISGAFSHPAVLLHQCGRSMNGEPLIHGILEGAGRPVPIFGGCAGRPGELTGATFSFDHRGVVGDGATVLVLDTARVSLDAVTAAGWRGIGTAKRVTRAEGNVIYEFDGRPALEVVGRYLPIEQDIVQVSPQHPLHVVRPDGTSVLRSPLAWNHEDGSVLLAGTVPEGSQVYFTVSAGHGIKDATVAETAKLRDRQAAPDLLLLYSCLGRLMALGPMIEDEVAAVHGLWNVPTIGFFTFGEFGATERVACDFLNNTCVVVALSGPAA